MTVPVATSEYFTVGPVPSGGSAVYGGVLTTQDGVTPIPANTLSAATLTFVDVDTQAVINSRNAQDVLNGGAGTGVTIDNSSGTGALQWILSPADNAFLRVDPPPAEGDVERHLAIFKWSWTGPGNLQLSNERKVFVLVEKYVGAVPSMGNGTQQYTDFVYESDGITPVDEARVWVTSDSAGQNIVAGPVLTTPTGQFLLMLNHGTYYVWVDAPDMALSGPNSVTI